MGVIVYGLVLLSVDAEAFRSWIREDGLAEWLTAIALGVSALYACAVALALQGARPPVPTAAALWLFTACGLAFGAFEEISWGQRIFGWNSPAWFTIHNDQHETNIHNLIVGGIKLNKVVFGKGLALFLAAYVLALSSLYRRNKRVRRWANRSRIPVARGYQVILWLVAVVVVRLFLSRDAKAAELLEFAGSVLFLLILTDPVNGRVLPNVADGIRRWVHSTASAEGAAAGRRR